eukprot:2634795-Pleurochrysis_carterae.AAC.1
MTESIYTVASLLRFMFQFLQPYDLVDVKELDCLWDWSSFFNEHLDMLAGFATNQMNMDQEYTSFWPARMTPVMF